MTTMTELTPAEAFANAVRSALSDLPAEEIDDLTDGLEADLAERATDEESQSFGDPEAYAEELRSAAGLPPRAAPRPDTLEGAIAGAWREFTAGLRGVYAHPAIARIGSFFVSLRPLWWLVRAWAFYCVLAWGFGVGALRLTPLTFVLGVGAVILSVQFGRGRWLPRPWMRKVLLGVNIVLVLLSPVIVFGTTAIFGSQTDAAYASGQRDGIREQTGLTYNGRGITNIFAYDASGKPLSAVQLYDQSGRPLYTVTDPSARTTDEPYLVPYAGLHRSGGWNVYPLEFVTGNQLKEDGNPKRDAISIPSQLPAASEPALVTPKATNTATPTPSPVATGSPTSTPTPTPTPSITTGP